MTIMDPNKLKHYQSLDKPAFEYADERINQFFAHAADSGYNLDTTGFLPHPGFYQAPYKPQTDKADIVLLGSPLDLGAIGLAGTRHGPQAVRNATRNFGPQHDVSGLVPFMACNIIDAGDVQWSETNLQTRLEDIYTTVKALSASGASVLNCGGEHTTAFGTLKGLSESHNNEAFGLIHIDAHCDTMSTWGGDAVNDGSVFRQAVLNGFIDPEQSIQIGIRGRANFLWECSHHTRMTVITADQVHDKGTQWVLDCINEKINKQQKTYFSLDVDGLDSQYMMATTGPEAFGLTPRQARAIIHGCYNMNIIGADIVEFNPNRDSDGKGALTTAALHWELLNLLTQARIANEAASGPTNW